MELQKIINLLEQRDDEELKFQTKKWYIINDQNNGQNGKGEQNDSTIQISTEIVKPFLEDYSDAYIDPDVANAYRLWKNAKIVLSLKYISIFFWIIRITLNQHKIIY